jgi:pimeloyl-ACP methyl ester carboxylesterase
MLTARWVLGLALAAAVFPASAWQVREVSFRSADGGKVFADLYGQGPRGVVLAHGAAYNKESWVPLARRLAAEGYRALAIDFRGYGRSRAGSDEYAKDEDVLAAVRYLHRQGAEKVSVIGASMGGGAAAEAAAAAHRGEIDKLILLSPVPVDDPEEMNAGSVLYIASRNERLAPEISAQYQRAPTPKKLIFLTGSAHAQHIFQTDQSGRLTRIILQFLGANTK